MANAVVMSYGMLRAKPIGSLIGIVTRRIHAVIHAINPLPPNNAKSAETRMSILFPSWDTEPASIPARAAGDRKSTARACGSYGKAFKTMAQDR